MRCRALRKKKEKKNEIPHSKFSIQFSFWNCNAKLHEKILAIFSEKKKPRKALFQNSFLFSKLATLKFFPLYVCVYVSVTRTFRIVPIYLIYQRIISKIKIHKELLRIKQTVFPVLIIWSTYEDCVYFKVTCSDKTLYRVIAIWIWFGTINNILRPHLLLCIKSNEASGHLKKYIYLLNKPFTIHADNYKITIITNIWVDDSDHVFIVYNIRCF